MPYLVATVVPRPGKQIALHSLTRDIGAVRVLPAGNLVDLVQEHDAVLLDIGQCLGFEIVVADQLGGFLVDERLERIDDFRLIVRRPPDIC